MAGGSGNRLVGRRPAEAPTLVLLHEGLGCVALWRDVPERLAAATGCGVFAYSRFGYGRSDAVTLPRPLSYMHDEARQVLPRVLDAAGIERAILLGHSDGGSIAAIHAGTVRDDRIAGMVLIAAHFFVEELEYRQHRRIRGARTKQAICARGWPAITPMSTLHSVAGMTPGSTRASATSTLPGTSRTSACRACLARGGRSIWDRGATRVLERTRGAARDAVDPGRPPCAAPRGAGGDTGGDRRFHGRAAERAVTDIRT